VLQYRIFDMCVAVCCSVLQRVAACCSVLQCAAVCCSVLQCVAVCCNLLQCAAVCCCVLQCVTVCCSALQYRIFDMRKSIIASLPPVTISGGGNRKSGEPLTCSSTRLGKRASDVGSPMSSLFVAHSWRSCDVGCQITWDSCVGCQNVYVRRASDVGSRMSWLFDAYSWRRCNIGWQNIWGSCVGCRSIYVRRASNGASPMSS